MLSLYYLTFLTTSLHPLPLTSYPPLPHNLFLLLPLPHPMSTVTIFIIIIIKPYHNPNLLIDTDRGTC